MKPYEILEHTADVGLRANGTTLKELFENAARGMFAVIAGGEPGSKIKTEIQKTVRIRKEVEDLEELLVDWLSELLYFFDKEKILFTDFRISELNNGGVTGEAYGEKIDADRTSLQTEIKAVTFHGLRIEENAKGFSCNIIFDV